MALKLGATALNKLYLGGTAINKAYLGTGVLFSSVAAFNPLSLFTSNQQGAWYDPSDLNSLFQDDDELVSVTTAGQAVAVMRDKSGRGHHMRQTTAAARPTYETGSGLHWLDFDGVDDSMRTANGVLNLADISIIVGISRFTELGRVFIGLPQAATTVVAPFTRLRISTNSNGRVESRINGSTYLSNLDIPDNANNVIFASNRKNTRLNGVTTSIDITPVALSFPNSVPLIISGNADAGNPHLGNFYGSIVLGRDATVTEIDDSTAYLATKSGVTLP